MQEGGNPIRVKLVSDLTKYDQRCTIGQEGETIPNIKLSLVGGFDSFVAIKFDNGAELDVSWNSLSLLK